MLSEKILTTENTTVSLNELFPSNTTQFIKPFEQVVDPDIHSGICLDFELSGREQKQKISPILRLASQHFFIFFLFESMNESNKFEYVNSKSLYYISGF